MIISHEYKYIFVEFPRTGTTTLSRELCQNYGGKRIARKHSTYQEFLKTATPEEKQYFVFTCIRNPLDDAVSHYFKLKTDHRERYTHREKVRNPKRLAEFADLFLYQYVSKHDLDFAAFFRKFYRIPYNNWQSMMKDRYDFVMRFESLEEDFACALKMLGIEPVRPLPFRNVTSERNKDFWSYYPRDLIPRAVRVFGPFMREWGYTFPTDWGPVETPWWNQLEFAFFNLFRRMYWSILRPVI